MSSLEDSAPFEERVLEALAQRISLDCLHRVSLHSAAARAPFPAR